MRALSIRQPWLWAILFAGKDVENRTRKCNYRGPVLLHASASLGLHEYETAIWAINDMRAQARSLWDRCLPVPPRSRPHKLGDPLPEVEPTTLPRGGLCGIARIVDCKFLELVDGQPTTVGWQVANQYGIKLADVRPLPFVPMAGALPVPFDVDLAMVVNTERDPDMAARVAAYSAAWRELSAPPKARARVVFRDLRIEAEGDVGAILKGLRGGPAGVTRG